MRVVTIARKPISEANVAVNILKYGAGALNINATRIPYGNEDGHGSARGAGSGKGYADTVKHETYQKGLGGVVEPPHPLGRFPTNLILEHLENCTVESCMGSCPAKLLDRRFFKTLGHPVKTPLTAPARRCRMKYELVDVNGETVATPSILQCVGYWREHQADFDCVLYLFKSGIESKEYEVALLDVEDAALLLKDFAEALDTP